MVTICWTWYLFCIGIYFSFTTVVYSHTGDLYTVGQVAKKVINGDYNTGSGDYILWPLFPKTNGSCLTPLLGIGCGTEEWNCMIWTDYSFSCYIKISVLHHHQPVIAKNTATFTLDWKSTVFVHRIFCVWEEKYLFLHTDNPSCTNMQTSKTTWIS